jgi:hypothetical protein
VTQPTTPPPRQQPPRGYPYPYNEPPPKTKRTWLWVVGIVGFFVLVGTFHNSNSSSTATSQGSTFEQASSADAPAPPTGPVTSFGAGTYAVGTDVVPGTYFSTGPDGSNPVGCYWARLKDTSGDSIITNDISKGQTVVTISSIDGAFKTEGCSTWHKR